MGIDLGECLTEATPVAVGRFCAQGRRLSRRPEGPEIIIGLFGIGARALASLVGLDFLIEEILSNGTTAWIISGCTGKWVFCGRCRPQSVPPGALKRLRLSNLSLRRGDRVSWMVSARIGQMPITSLLTVSSFERPWPCSEANQEQRQGASN